MRYMKVKKYCKQCNEVYYVSPSRDIKSLYCSLECRLIGMRKASYIKKCETCGKAYKVYEADKQSKYCSNKCKHISRSVVKLCAYCGKPFDIKKSHAKSRVYCSRDCMTNDYKVRFNNLSYDRKDKNHGEIVGVLKDAGAKVLDLSLEKFGCPDIAIGWNGRFVLAEIKSKKGKLSASQVKFFDEWHGYVVILRSKEDAISLLSKLSSYEIQRKN